MYGVWIKHNLLALGFMIPLSIGLILAFQNCSGRFQSTTASNSVATTAVSTSASQCAFNGQVLQDGQAVQAYLNSTEASGSSCVSQVRTCTSGVLTGSYAYASCSVGAPASCLFNGQTVSSGQSVVAYQNSSVPAGSTCVSQTSTCTNGTWSSPFTNAFCQVGQPASCQFNGITYTNGSAITAFQASTAVAGSTCVSQTETCVNGQFSGTYAFPNCTVDQPASCLFNGTTLASGQTVPAYAAPLVALGQTCSSQTLTCSNGSLLGGSNTYPTCSVATVAQLALSPAATDWLVKDVCVDNQSRLLVYDPYYECPSGASRRKIQAGEPLPYFNHDMPNLNENASYPLINADGTSIYVSIHDWNPFGVFSLNSWSDGFDVYAVKNGWVQFTETRDGGGYGTTWFDSACGLGGFNLFPTTGFLSGGTTPNTTFGGSYWEQNGSTFPGPCAKPTATNEGVWKLQKQVPFGGVNGNPIKHMDSLVAYTGVSTDPNFVNYGHLEVFYFTQQYGVTKWEVWVPVQRNPTKTSYCVEPDTVTLNGITFVVANCEDWSVFVPATTASIPVWPIPEANLLQHSHFDSGFSDPETNFGEWHRGGKSAEGNLINWGTANSTYTDSNPNFTNDKRNSQNGAGVAFLKTNCGGTCTGPGVQEIYQELPISTFVNNGTYLFGIDARTEQGETQGQLQITLQQIGANDKVVWSDFIQGTLSSDNGDGRNGEIDSAYLSTAFISKTATMPVMPTATRVRFFITPLTGQAFDILDSYLNPFPTISTNLLLGGGTITPPPPTPEATMPTGSYQSSCYACQMLGSQLTCSCSNVNGEYLTSTVDISKCTASSQIGNSNGTLVCP